MNTLRANRIQHNWTVIIFWIGIQSMLCAAIYSDAGTMNIFQWQIYHKLILFWLGLSFSAIAITLYRPKPKPFRVWVPWRSVHSIFIENAKGVQSVFVQLTPGNVHDIVLDYVYAHTSIDEAAHILLAKIEKIAWAERNTLYDLYGPIDIRETTYEVAKMCARLMEQEAYDYNQNWTLVHHELEYQERKEKQLP